MTHELLPSSYLALCRYSKQTLALVRVNCSPFASCLVFTTDPPTSSSGLSIAKSELRAQTYLVEQKTNIFALNARHTGGIQSVSGEL